MPACVFCVDPADREHERVLVRGELAYVVLNKYPYNPGHLLVVPLRHVGELEELTAEENAELQALLQRSLAAIRRTTDPARVQHRAEPRARRGRGDPRAPPLARRAPVERRHELHARRGRDARAARTARGDVPAA